MSSLDVSRIATRGLPALKRALCVLAKFGLPSPSLLRNPNEWPATITEAVQDAYAALSCGQDAVARGALTLAVQKLGKLQLISGVDDKAGPRLRTVWKELSEELPPDFSIRLKEFRLYLAGLTERFLAQRVHKSTRKSTIKSVAALKSQVQLRAALGVDSPESCRLSVREVAALLKDAGVEVSPSCASALVLRLAGAPQRGGAEAAAEETLLSYVLVERALISSLSDAALCLLLNRRRAAAAAAPTLSREPDFYPPPTVPSHNGAERDGTPNRDGSPNRLARQGAPSASWRAEREAAWEGVARAQRGGSGHLCGNLHSPEPSGRSFHSPERHWIYFTQAQIQTSPSPQPGDSNSCNSRRASRASREGLGIDAEDEFVQYVCLAQEEGPTLLRERLREAYAASPEEQEPPSPPALSRLQWLQQVQAQAVRAAPARLLGSSDRRDLEHAWLGRGEEEQPFPLERPWPLERPRTPRPQKQDASESDATLLRSTPALLVLPSKLQVRQKSGKSPRLTDFRNMHV